MKVCLLLVEAVKAAEKGALCGADRRRDELPEHLRDCRKRLSRLKKAEARLEREVVRQAEKIEKRAGEEKKRDRKKRGCRPKVPDETPPAGTKANVTNPESLIMKRYTGYVQG